VIHGLCIWPSGAFISQTGGHADFRLPTEIPARPGDVSYGERTNMAMIVDGVDAVRKRVREQLALGAAHIKPDAWRRVVLVRPVGRDAVQPGGNARRGECG
jgi:hypothetical protein